MDIPQSLDDWSLPIIQEFLEKGYYETEYFDFKETLPDSRDAQEKQRFVKSCAAFANSQGGFLVFGIANDRTLPVEQRLLGLDPALDFPEHFGIYPQKCKSSVSWKFRNPPIELQNGRVIQIVHIPGSWDLPHCYETNDNGFCFPKRTNKGNETMSFEEVRMNFLQFYEKRLKLGLLAKELTFVIVTAQNMIIPEQDEASIVALHSFDLHVIESVFADTYTIFAEDTELYTTLTGLRSNCNVANNKITQFNFTAVKDLDAITRQNVYRIHNQKLKSTCKKIIEQATMAINRLEAFRKP